MTDSGCSNQLGPPGVGHIHTFKTTTYRTGPIVGKQHHKLALDKPSTELVLVGSVPAVTALPLTLSTSWASVNPLTRFRDGISS